MSVMLVAVGRPGSDAPGAVFKSGHWVPQPGWEPRQMEVVRSALAIADEAVGMKDTALQKQAFDTSAMMLKTQAEYLAKVGQYAEPALARLDGRADAGPGALTRAT